MEEHGVHPKTIEYMKKNKLGMWSKADKKLVKENTPPKDKMEKMAGKVRTSADHSSKDCGGKCVFHATAGGKLKRN